VYGPNCEYFPYSITNSTFLSVTGMQKLKTLVNIPQNQTISMIYQASRDGFSSNVFHSKCNGVRGTLIVIKSNNNSNIFGGYTEADWSLIGYQYDPNAFLFSLINTYNTPVKMLVTYPQEAIYSYYSYYGPTFGSGLDLYINDGGSYSYSNLGYSYQLPSFLNTTSGSPSAQSFLAGSYNFKAFEIEVYAYFQDRK
jgi:hypothetical protein